jgi:hypothetical protein
MTFKDTLKKELTNENKANELRYKASKLNFVLISLLFFISFFLYGA